MEKKKVQKCWNCGNFRAYYTRGICSYDKTPYGFCNKKRKVVDKSKNCDNWSKSFKMKKIREGLRQKVLERISEDIATMKQIMIEEKQE